MTGKTGRWLLLLCCAACLAGCAAGHTEGGAQAKQSGPPAAVQTKAETGMAAAVRQKDLGALTPEAALDYMKRTKDLVIVDVPAEKWYRQKTFTGAVNIPIEELTSAEADERYREIPAGRPVLLHCRRGMIVPGAYRRVKELRPDIPEISCIDGAPLFDEYNDWLAAQKAP